MCLFLGVLNHPVQPPFSFGVVDLAASLHQQVVGVEEGVNGRVDGQHQNGHTHIQPPGDWDTHRRHHPQQACPRTEVVRYVTIAVVGRDCSTIYIMHQKRKIGYLSNLTHDTHTHTHTYTAHTHILHTHTHTLTNTHTHTNIHAYTHTQTYTHTNAHTRGQGHAYKHTRTTQ